MQSITPECTHSGLGSFHFARHYFGNRCFFLFLRLLRCFSSPGSLRTTMDSSHGTWGLLMWVSPFRYPWIKGYLHLPMAFRSLSRLSSALSAKASTLRSCLLNLTVWPPAGWSTSTHIALCVQVIHVYKIFILYLCLFITKTDFSVWLPRMS